MKFNELLGYLDPITHGSLIRLKQDVPDKPLNRDVQLALHCRRSMAIGGMHRRFEQRRRPYLKNG